MSASYPLRHFAFFEAFESKARFVKKYFETIAVLGGPVRLFQNGLSARFSKKHVRGFSVRIDLAAAAK
jgi:hypothetical protein